MFPRLEKRWQSRFPEQELDEAELGGESWLPLDGAVAARLLREIALSPLDENEIEKAKRVLAKTIESYSDHRYRLNACSDVQNRMNVFLFSNVLMHEVSSPLDTLDTHLSAVSYYAAQSTSPTSMADYLTKSLSNGARKQVNEVLAELDKFERANPENRAYLPSSISPNQRDVLTAEAVLRGLVSFGMWKAIEASRLSASAAQKERKNRAVVGSVALDLEGKVLETAYRGEDPNSSKHSEHILLEKLRKGGLVDKAFIVCVNLEPCLHRSEKHAARGCGVSCSQLLVNAGIPIVGYILTDDNPKQNGRGGKRLEEHDIMVFAADNPAAQALASSLQVLNHLRVAAKIAEKDQ